MANVFDEFDEPETNPFDEFDGQLDPKVQAYIERGKALAKARAGGTPLALPPGHNAPHRLLPEGADPVGMATSYALGGIEGLPIAGPLIEKGTRGAAALAVSPFTDQPLGEIYDEMGRIKEDAQFNHPYAATAGNVTGATLGTIPMVMAAPSAFGAGAGNFGVRSGLSALSGMGIGGTDAAVRSGGDMDAILRGAGGH